MTNFEALPDGLPVPVDDGSADHLKGRRMPDVRLASTRGDWVDLSALPAGRTVLFAYPMTGKPGVDLPDGWDEIPGARGCTPQNCAFRDRYGDFVSLGITLFALSTQTTEYQTEMVERLRIPYPALSDADLVLTDALRLPTFVADGLRLLRRLTMIVRDGTIEHVFYPVFPPDRSAQDTLGWLNAN